MSAMIALFTPILMIALIVSNAYINKKNLEEQRKAKRNYQQRLKKFKEQERAKAKVPEVPKFSKSILQTAKIMNITPQEVVELIEKGRIKGL